MDARSLASSAPLATTQDGVTRFTPAGLVHPHLPLIAAHEAAHRDQFLADDVPFGTRAELEQDAALGAARLRSGRQHRPRVAAPRGLVLTYDPTSWFPDIGAQGELGPGTPVQRDDLYMGSHPSRPSQPSPLGSLLSGGQFGLVEDKLEFTSRSFPRPGREQCPSCHRPTTPQWEEPPDREATEPRLVSWAIERGATLKTDHTLRHLQMEPGTEGQLADDLGYRLIMSVLRTHEFKGSDDARKEGAAILRRRWPGLKETVQQTLSTWFRTEYLQAVARTPKGANFVSRPAEFKRVRTEPYNRTEPVGRWGAVAVVGSRWGNMIMVDIGHGTLWFHLPDKPQWLYSMSGWAFRRQDPFTGEVTRQVADKTQFAAHLMPVLLTVAGFTLGFSARIGFVIAGIMLEELAEEMNRELRGEGPRSGTEIAESGIKKLVIDRVLNRLFGSGGRSAPGRVAGDVAAKAERVAERSAPLVRRELIASEEPLVNAALRQHGARKVTDPAMQARGYVAEVEVLVEGQRHVYRLGRDGKWCRYSKSICRLDLGDDVARLARETASSTPRRLEEVREQLQQAQNEMDFLRRVYDRMRATGRMDVSTLSRAEREMLNELAPTGNAADLTLAQLRDLPRRLNLTRDIRVATEQETRLITKLYQEGRPIYETMRAASPSHAARTRVLARDGGFDAVSGAPLPPALRDVEHIVPLRDVVEMRGFRALRPEDQLAIVNDVNNLVIIHRTANRSRGARAWSQWPQGRLFYDDAALARMARFEAEKRSYLEARIAELARRR